MKPRIIELVDVFLQPIGIYEEKPDGFSRISLRDTQRGRKEIWSYLF